MSIVSLDPNIRLALTRYGHRIHYTALNDYQGRGDAQLTFCNYSVWHYLLDVVDLSQLGSTFNICLHCSKKVASI